MSACHPIKSLFFRVQSLLSCFRVQLARVTGVTIGPNVIIGAQCDLRLGFEPARCGRLGIGDGCQLEAGVILRPYGGHILIGTHVHLGPGTVVYGHGGVEIGDACLIAMHCRILSSDHPIPALDRRIRWEPDVLKPTRIGRDVWLGAGVTVLGGVTIGEGCVIGAGAVVTKDIPPGSIAVGLPAHVIGHRPASSAAHSAPSGPK